MSSLPHALDLGTYRYRVQLHNDGSERTSIFKYMLGFGSRK